MAEMTALAAPTAGQKTGAWLLASMFLGLGAWGTLAWSHYCLVAAIPLGVGFCAGICAPQKLLKATLSAFIVTMALPSLLRSEVIIGAALLLPLLWLSSFIGSVLRRHVHALRECASESEVGEVRRRHEQVPSLLRIENR